jgi:alpha-beta hydrolase superfamily lysophospholipase
MDLAVNLAPTAEQLNRTKQKIDAHIQSIAHHPERREGAFPYYLFHAPDQPIRGTVMLFHGFSAKPHQMWRLADYLFHNGFNVYQPSIAGHTLVNPARNWPQVDLKPEYAEPLKQKVMRDPVLQNFVQNLLSNPRASRPTQLQQIGLTARLLMLEPRLIDIVKSLELPHDPDFARYFKSSHSRYLNEAQARLVDLEEMPGPIYTVGLSVGGAIALGLAASRPERVEGVVAFAPLLKIVGAEQRRYINLAGPLDISESGWDPNLRFPLGCLTAADRLGSSIILSDAAVRSLRNIPTFVVLTENEDAADLGTNKDFYQQICDENSAFHLYPAPDLVPHPMVDPTEVSQNMSNRFWQSLYQETLRFLTTGKIDAANLRSTEQNADLPQVPGV